MAVIGFIIGSVVGAVLGVVGWVFLDLAMVQAFGLYLGTGVLFGLTCALPGLLRTSVKGRTSVLALN